jgi:hypothetical protein
MLFYIEGGCHNCNLWARRCGRSTQLLFCFAGRTACRYQEAHWWVFLGTLLHSQSGFSFGHGRTRSGELPACTTNRQRQS